MPDIGGLSLNTSASISAPDKLSRQPAGGEDYHLKHDASNAISGFYYDEQMKNEGLTMSLHPSMKYVGPDTFWAPADSREYGGIYNTLPIVKAIISEDFQIAAANQWDENTIMDEATQLFNSVKGLSPYIDYFANKGKEISQRGQEADINGNTTGDSVARLVNDGVGWLSNAAQKVTPYLNRALVIQGSRFSYYNGTSVGFGNMTMKFTLFSDWVDGKWMSCIDKLKGPTGPGCCYGLLDYCLGKYVEWSQDTDKDKEFNQFVGWQLPPGGFKPDLKNVDNIQDGTLLLIIGDMYAIPNLVVQDAQFTFSKQIMKYPKSTSEIDLFPMYCDVQLTLKPAAKYTDQTFMKALDGSLIVNRKKKFIDLINSRL